MRWPLVWRSTLEWQREVYEVGHARKDEALAVERDRILQLTGKLDEVEAERSDAIREADSANEQISVLTRELELAHTTRVSMESLAAERRAENERLIDQMREMREDTRRVLEERLKSLDSLNLRLMTPRVEDKPPDPATFKRSEMQELGKRAITTVHQLSRQMDERVLTALYPEMFRRPGTPTVAEAPPTNGEGRPSMDAVV